MAITTSELLTFANEKTSRSETDITNYLRDVIHDLEIDLVVLETETNITTTADQANYNLATLKANYRRPIHVWPKDSDGNLHQELEELSYPDYKDHLIYRSASSRPYKFSIWNDVMYVWPAPNASYPTLVVVSPEDHGDSVTTIRYPEQYRDLLKNGCAWKVFERYGQQDKPIAQACLQAYELAKSRFVGKKNRERPTACKYNDL